MTVATAPSAGPPSTRRWSNRSPWRGLPFDLLLAAGAVTVELVLRATGPAELRTQPWPATVCWSLLSAVPIALRTVGLWPAIALCAVLVLVPLVTGYQALTVVFALVLLTYQGAARLRLRPAIAGTVVLWGPVLVANAVVTPTVDTVPYRTYALLNIVLVALVAFFAGRTVHGRQTRHRALEDRARAAEENQRSLAEQAVTDERRRIARELHDVVAHHVSVMGVLATGARRVLRRSPETADEALGTIEETSRTTLREMRRLLDVLRTDEPVADLSPQPGLAGIEALLEQVRDAGLPVALRVDGAPVELDPGVALTVFRIVQEALTNTLKHAGAATAQVRLSFGIDWLVVEVFDTGRGPALTPARLGHGLVGMRERVALYGGSLRTGPRPGGGFRVYAKIPMEHLGAPTSEGAA
ncbi:sensor histidine kinase [Polymorphospora rubra]|uniref:histidine kinase n=1 Tax=Polymorphospora rubra TaxID=338584 RepID=A0A810ND59_9ACTN|nr:sensor histidine kinase [Polymorphospora rubra]BCJ69818.1 two-component sensor histidine kinase [Polymorphospora rubra]